MHDPITLNTATLSPDANILVAVTTCERPHLLSSHLEPLVQSLQSVNRADLVLSVDGLTMPGNQEAVDIALAMGIDCIVSEHSEGVGISKNRVAALLGGYEFYFFLEDDVRVKSGRLFSEHIQLYSETGIHHFSLHDPRRLLDELNPTTTVNGCKIRHAMYGSAQVNFFTRTALQRVGGWHPAFAKIRRGGHTEHSFRIYRSRLCPAPFNLCNGLLDTLICNDSPSVVHAHYTGYPVGDHGLFELENELINEKLGFMPFSASSHGRLVNSA